MYEVGHRHVANEKVLGCNGNKSSVETYTGQNKKETKTKTKQNNRIKSVDSFVVVVQKKHDSIKRYKKVTARL